MRKERLRALALPIAVFAAALAIALFVLNGISSRQEDASARLCEESVRRAAVACYSIEGRYPMDIEYLKENYGLAYDEEKLIVRYDAFASNVMPDIDVIRTGEER